jgi:hypothetical protein
MNGDKKRLAWLNIVVILGILGTLAAILYPAIVRPPDNHHRPRCISRLKQLATSLMIYLTDSDERYPPNTWVDELHAYAKNLELMTCPQVKEKKQGMGLRNECARHGQELRNSPKPRPVRSLIRYRCTGQGCRCESGRPFANQT